MIGPGRSHRFTESSRPQRGLSVAALVAAIGPLFLAVELVAAEPSTDDPRDDAPLSQWTLEGPLPPAVEPTDPRLPLSDQIDAQGWLHNGQRSDEFEGRALETSRWTPHHRTWRGRPPALFSEDNVSVNDGRLQLWMRKNGGPAEDGSEFHTYTSAAVQAKEKSLYGYYEVRAKPMDSAGSSSFWFAGQSKEWRTEIDVYEFGGKAIGHEHRFNMNVHVFWSPDGKRHRSWAGHWKSDFRFADDFHVYGLAWTPKRLSFFVDGHEVRRIENAYWHQPLYLIFDSETMPDWLGLPADDDLPSVYEIDYVRVWDLPRRDRTVADPRSAPAW